MKTVELLLAACVAAAPLAAQQPAALAAVPAAAVPSASAALAEMQRTNSEDYHAVMQALLGEHKLAEIPAAMEQMAAAGEPAALLWCARREITALVAANADMSTAPRAVKARAMVADAAKKGYVPAMVELARFAAVGFGLPADDKAGKQILTEACKKGSSRARAAYLLVTDRLADPSKFDAPEIVSELKKGNFYLEEIIASLYGDDPRALTWLKRAAEHGSAQAPYIITQAFAPEISAQEFKDNLMLAVERHHPEALALLGLMQAMGDESTVPRDREAALKNLELAAALGARTGLIALAMRYHCDPEHYSAEEEFELYRSGMELGEVTPAVSYAYCLTVGHGCTADAAKGIELLKKLADAGQPYAMVALASCCYNGSGMEPDVRRAVDYLGQASSAGVPGLYAVMAALTEMGNSAAKPDARRAAVYLKMAEEQEGPAARAAYDFILKNKAWSFLDGNGSW